VWDIQGNGELFMDQLIETIARLREAYRKLADASQSATQAFDRLAKSVPPEGLEL